MYRFIKRYKYVILTYLVLTVLTVFADLLIDSTKHDSKAVLASTTIPQILAAVATATPLATAVPILSPVPSPSVMPSASPDQILSKDKYKIAIVGDSMVETMGDNLDYLATALKEKYPDTEFEMYNYGVGSENVLEGSDRLVKSFAHDKRNYPPITVVKPDVIIVGSWAYNPPAEYDKNVHWNYLAGIINKSKEISGKVYVLAEVAPLEDDFGKGPKGVNWPSELVAFHIQKIVELMQNARHLPNALGVSLIDVYSQTTQENSLYGKTEYVDASDHIHPSVLGHTITAETIRDTIVLE
ncbi:hypothetical protein A2V80_02450 [Candidatus Woesebacteria bacterium RBG_16_39_8b]|uniref:SGNH hydrolase-type esterase domain-containing protein n=1 Tax=Candidatus Woesebacteria bacterium RBG_16_39_8b TaxID=1802482 RepID=A0A1F7X8I8_9BACT|nr:MAG: hypothetical protein A2V80_02450 [Candidatus Woesebacteria bacterium RBG_16_39_8b]